MKKIYNSKQTTDKINYQILYENEKIKRINAEIEIKKKNKEINKLKSLIKLNKKQLLSYINSKTAINGYKEEELVCNDLKNELIKKEFWTILGDDHNKWTRIGGNNKCDIQSNNGLLAQVKKFKHKQFQQLDRHWIDHLIKNIPQLTEVTKILKNLCEYPILKNGTHVDKTISLKKLCTSNYSMDTLNNFLKILNKNKKSILNYAFYGTNPLFKPKYLFGVEYVNKKRTNIVLFIIEEIINYLEKLEFKISPRKTVIILGDDGILSLQRKGGDCGKKSSNQLQIKIIISKIINKVENLQYKL